MSKRLTAAQLKKRDHLTTFCIQVEKKLKIDVIAKCQERDVFLRQVVKELLEEWVK